MWKEAKPRGRGLFALIRKLPDIGGAEASKPRKISPARRLAAHRAWKPDPKKEKSADNHGHGCQIPSVSKRGMGGESVGCAKRLGRSQDRQRQAHPVPVSSLLGAL